MLFKMKQTKRESNIKFGKMWIQTRAIYKNTYAKKNFESGKAVEGSVAVFC